MTLTTEQYRELVDAIAAAPSLAALDDLRRTVHGADVRGGFVELLVALRREQLDHPRAPKIA